MGGGCCPNVQKATLHEEVRRTVEPGARLYTDAWAGYSGLSGDYQHEVIDHAIEYVRGQVHTNGVENFWSLLKRITGASPPCYHG